LGPHLVEVDAEVPQSELLNYAIDLKSRTSGTGSFELKFDHYAAISGRLADEVIKNAPKFQALEV
jgi:elongation factor G